MSEKRTLKIIPTADGSTSIFWEELNETYHSLHGATQESRHVYIEAGLEYLLSKKQHINILEVGLGTGLNVLLSLEFALKNPDVSIQLTSLEPLPLPQEVLDNLDFAGTFSPPFSTKLPSFWQQIHTCLPDQKCYCLPNFEFRKLHQKLEDFESSEVFDLIYYDAFAPSKQPEMWELDNLQKIGRLTVSDGILVTYSSSGKFRKNLTLAGFSIEKLKGPVGKKEMVRGYKLASQTS